MTVTTRNEKSNVQLDSILIKCGLTGRYYVLFIAMTILMFLLDSVTGGDYVFVADKVTYRCVDSRFANDSCASLSNSTEICTEWVYDDPDSFFAEFHLACQEWKRTLVGTVYSFGYAIGLLIIGPLSDRFGRKSMIVVAMLTASLVGIARSLANSYWLYIFLQFLGPALGNSFSPSYILMIEMVAHEKRVLVKSITGVGAALGYVVMALAAWLFPNWRQYLLVLYVPGLLFSSCIFILDESPRWLLTKDRKEEAVTILEKMAKRSNIKLDKNIFDDLTNNDGTQNGFVKAINETFTSRVLMKRFCLCLVWWTVSTFVNYGIKINSALIPGNKYVNFAVVGLASLPARIVIYWMLISFSRKASLSSTFFLCALVFFVQPFASEWFPWISTLLYFSGKILVNIFFGVTYILTSELFPTYTRNSMHALCSSLGRVGAIIAPQTPLLMVYWQGLPAITFGAAALVAALVTQFAPGTGSDVLPDTVLQAEALGQTTVSLHAANRNQDNETETKL